MSKQNYMKYLNTLVQLACWSSLTLQYIAAPVFAKGSSMTPTLPNASIVVVNRLGNCTLGDVVACKSPLEPGKFVCKRIVGIEGDEVLLDPRVQSNPENLRFVVPRNHVYLLGDNLMTSHDSRYYGPIPTQNIVGKVSLMLYPSIQWVH